MATRKNDPKQGGKAKSEQAKPRIEPDPIDDPQCADGGLAGNLARQAGLAARYGLESVGQAAHLVAEPLRDYVVNPIARAVGVSEVAASDGIMTALADTLGLPSPEIEQELPAFEPFVRMHEDAALARGEEKGASVYLVEITHPEATEGIFDGRYSGIRVSKGEASATYNDGSRYKLFEPVISL